VSVGVGKKELQAGGAALLGLLAWGDLCVASTAAAPTRTPVLPQIALPHNYYFRELYLPQLTSGPSSVAWSADAKSLIYAMAGSLWRQEVGSGEAEQLTDSDDGYDYQPDASPDGRRVAFVRYDGRAMELMLLDLASGEVRPLTHDGAVSVEPRWSPDGARLAFVSTRGTGHFLVHAARLGESGLVDLQVVTPDRKSAVKRYYYSPWDHAISPAWTRDGKGLYFVSNREIGHGTGDVVRLDLANPGAEPVPILHEETSWKTRPDLSPDGTRLVYSSYLGGAWHQLWLLPAAGGSAFPLTYGAFDNTAPRWSPDGKSIAFISNRDGNTSLWTVDAFDGGQKKVEIRERRYRKPHVPLTLRIVDELGQATAGRLSVTDSRGRFYAPEDAWVQGDDSISSAQRFEAHYFASPGLSQLDVPKDHLRVTLSRGPELAITILDVDATTSPPGERVLTPKRLALPEGFALGWSGDLHVHMSYGGTYRNNPRHLVQQARAEGVGLVYDLVVNKEQRIPDQAAFTPEIDHAATADAILVHGQEFHTSYWGHLGLLHLKDHLILPDYAGYPFTAAASLYPHNSAVADRAHAQGGVVGYVHPFEESEVRSVETGEGAPLTNELPVDAALGKVDYYEVVGFSDHRASAEVWYRLLNCGLHLPAGAGTDAMANYASLRGPVGLNRVYVPGSGIVDADRFLAQLKAGHSFATNGPLLGLKLESAAPGDTLTLEKGEHVLSYKVNLRSNVPVDHLELIWNGEVAATLKLEGSHTEADLEGHLKVNGSGWLLLRAWSDHPLPELFDLYPYATTSPIYVGVGGAPLHSKAAGAFFLKWLDRMRPLVAAHPDYRTTEEREAVLGDIDRARAFYEKCASEGTPPSRASSR
jgi:Tol biopolymer transport system component